MEALTNPKVTSFLSVGPLPDNLKNLLQIVAEGEWRDASTEHVYRRHSAETIRDASAAFLAIVLFGKKTDPYRALGLPTGAPISDVRDHKRLLLKWLHPDRNAKINEQEYLSLVIEAAEAIESGRSHSFGAPPKRQATPRAQATPRKSKAPRASRSLQSVAGNTWRSVRESARRSVALLRQAAKVSAVVIAALLVSLLAWRYVMDEPIGSSVERYTKLAAELVSWR